MNTKNFKLISKFLTWFFRITAILSIVGAVIRIALFIFGESIIDKFSYTSNIDYLINIFASSSKPSPEELIRPNLIMAALLFVMMTFVSIQSSSLFSYLVTGKTPFTENFAHRMSTISKILIITDITIPIIRSLMISLFTSVSYYIHIGISWMFIVGLLLYIFSGIIHYGVSLQELSDETV